ncbi:MAG TPA: glycoside hydrolase family 71/99-like protein [Planctomycetota bacterium]|nr:glycoside hydrolase family 71/99-like protein [Planctomycetota bacterium]HRR78896.1 glycoside hydrolase family 71/99-like protein [Planctomycetota bacterium]HRT93901.1 glycoside hydrolase family 71/99-like protein [Planctomycetota bacterium]
MNRPYQISRLACGALFGLCAAARAEGPLAMTDQATREQVIAATMRPYDGPSVKGVDASTLDRKVMCGYQGWFAAEGDGSGRGWFHYGGRDGFRPGSCSIDLWPDVSELDADEKFPTPFRHADGRVAHVFSSLQRKTVLRHFEWMRQYGLDGVFAQRFGGELRHPKGLNHATVVLGHCREGANRTGRAYAVMYDLSGLGAGETRLVADDWKLLVDRMHIARDPRDAAYLRHRGKPVVALWGIGFSDGRRYTLDECERLIRFLKSDPKYGGNTVMLGLPTWWRTLRRDCVADPRVHDLVRQADIVSPWAVGRVRSPEQVPQFARETWAPDLAWCREHGKDYLPVVFPGFSWHNLRPASPLGDIPRLQGRFLWTQYAEAVRAGATMVYQAMFDEMDEGTAIFKCTNDPPVGESKFLTYEGLPSDHYLWLVGQAARLLRGEIPRTAAPPERR